MFTKFTKYFVILYPLFLFMLCSQAQAQATRTWVSGVGDDANPCSRTAPCKTFAGAISKTATAGEINVLDPGGFGGVTITKSITIDGSGGSIAGVLVSGTNAIIVNAAATSVVNLRNLDIDGLNTGLNGIRFLAGAALHVENVQIYGFATNGIDFEPSGNSQLFIKDSIIRGNPGGGILIKPSGSAIVNASIDNIRLENNSFGLRNEDRSFVSIQDSVISGNLNNGLILSTAAAVGSLNIDNCSVTNNAGTVISSLAGVKSNGANSTVRISRNTIMNNSIGLLPVLSGKILSFGNNQIDGNGSNGAPTGSLFLN